MPAWSPDGRRIAFEYNPSPTGLRPGASDIYVMNAERGRTTVRRLTSVLGFDGDPAWSPDGRKIVFESTRSGNADIWVMNADGTNPQGLTPGARPSTATRRGLREAAASSLRVRATETGRST